MTRTIMVKDDEVTLTDLMEAYRELQAAEESLAELKEAVKGAKERLDRAKTELRVLFGKLDAQESDD